MKPFLDSTDAVHDGPELQRRMQRDGYLFIRNLLPKDVLESLRMQFLEIMREAGWVKLGTRLEEAIANLDAFCVEPEPAYMEIYHRQQKLPAFHALQHHPSLIGVLERLLGDTVLPHPRLIARTLFPERDAYTTPAHQDFIPIQGTAETYTAWIPLQDVPPELGGLQIAAGSHRRGVYDIRPALGAGGLEVTDPLEGTWVNSPFNQSDVLIFHSMTVHQGRSFQGERLRLSIDGRFQRVRDPIDAGSLLPHGGLIAWEEVYADWSPEQMQYYWQQWDLQVTEYDNRYHDKRDRMAMEMARRGDMRARSALQRIISRGTDAALREQAAELLATLETASVAE